jgi:phosphoribosylglycinamide formyltransferase-1
MSATINQDRLKPFRIVIMLSGRGSNFKALYERVKNYPELIEISLVVTDNPEAAGIKFAQSIGINSQIITKIKGESSNDFNGRLIEVIKGYCPDLIVLAGYMRILSGNFVKAFNNKIINIHPSLLPKFPGLSPQAQALEAKEQFSGATVHFVNEQVDAGAIIAQAVVPVLADDDENSLAARILEKEHILLPGVVLALAAGRCELDKNGEVNFMSAEDFAGDSSIKLKLK